MNSSVLHYPNSELRVPAQPVPENQFGTDALQHLLQTMIAAMRRLNGIGFAATQFGIPQRAAVIELNDGPLVVINPEIDHLSKKKETDEEGCLSVPEVFGQVQRHASLVLTAYRADGTQYRVKAKGLFARVIQHEVDHLNGNLFLDRCHRLTSGISVAKQLGLTIPPLHHSDGPR